MIEALDWKDENAARRAVQVVLGGGIVISTTDTVLGLMASASREGFEALNRAKERETKPYIVLVAHFDQLGSLVCTDQLLQIEKFVKKCWPGPLTIIMPLREDFRAALGLPWDTIGVRIPAHEGLLKLLEMSGPVFSTSANKAGKPTPVAMEQIDPDILAHASLLVDGAKGYAARALPSTIIDCTGSCVKVVRDGAYPIEKLEKIWGQTFQKGD